MIRRSLLLCGLVLTLAAAPAAAQGFLSATVGRAMGGLMNPADLSAGGSLGFWSKKSLGVEGDLGFVRNIAGPKSLNARTICVDVLFGPRIKKGAWRPFGLIGGGLLGAVTQVSDVFQFSSSKVENHFALQAGGGVDGRLMKHLGVRIDVRYVRDL